jgi:hypothetical protein
MLTLEEIVTSEWFYAANVAFDLAVNYWLWREFKRGGIDRALAVAGFGINTLCLYRDWEAFLAARAGRPVEI